MARRRHYLNSPPRLPMVFASVLGCDLARMLEECRDVLEGGADGLHIDIMDGHFVPNLTMGPRAVQCLRSHLPQAYLDVHLMVEQPERFVVPFADAGADCLTFHIEATAGRDKYNQDELVHLIHGAGCQAGVSLNPHTPAGAVEGLLGQVDLVLVMSVHPGFGGQTFMAEVLDKARWLAERKPATVRLEMDGGLNRQTAEAARSAGVEILVAGTAVFGASDRRAMCGALRGR